MVGFIVGFDSGTIPGVFEGPNPLYRGKSGIIVCHGGAY